MLNIDKNTGTNESITDRKGWKDQVNFKYSQERIVSLVA